MSNYYDGDRLDGLLASDTYALRALFFFLRFSDRYASAELVKTCCNSHALFCSQTVSGAPMHNPHVAPRWLFEHNYRGYIFWIRMEWSIVVKNLCMRLRIDRCHPIRTQQPTSLNNGDVQNEYRVKAVSNSKKERVSGHQSVRLYSYSLLVLWAIHKITAESMRATLCETLA